MVAEAHSVATDRGLGEIAGRTEGDFGSLPRLQRGRSEATRLTLREKLVVGSALLPLTIFPWLLGGMRYWTHLAFVIASILPVIALLLPLDRQSATIGESLRRLAGFPPLIPSLLLAVYIVIQMANPAFEMVLTPAALWPFEMRALPSESYVSWLPTGYRVVREDILPSQHLMVFTGIFMICASVWAGARQRKALRLLLWGIVINGFALAWLVVLQKLTSADQILWSFHSRNENFGGTFVYRNHGGTYLYTCMGLALALCFHYLHRAFKTGGSAGPLPFLLFISFFIWGSVIMMGSRGAAIGATAILVFGVTLFGAKVILSRSVRGALVVLVTMSAISVAALVAYPYVEKPVQETLTRLRLTFDGEPSSNLVPGSLDNSTNLRVRVAKASLTMIQFAPWFGYGAAGFSYFFPFFQQYDEELLYKDSAIYRDKHIRRPYHRRRLFMQRFIHTHSDWLQYTIEYGAVGMGFILAAFLAPGLRVIHLIGKAQLFNWVLTAICIVLLLHAIGDFVLSNPPTLSLLCVAVVVSACWMLETAQPRKEPA